MSGAMGVEWSRYASSSKQSDEERDSSEYARVETDATDWQEREEVAVSGASQALLFLRNRLLSEVEEEIS